MSKSDRSSITPPPDTPLDAAGRAVSDHQPKQASSLFERQKRLREILSRVLTGQVIPRVFEANGGAAKLSVGLDHAAQEAFRALVLKGSLTECTDFVQKRIDDGLSLRSLCLQLFTHTAQELGEMWDQDLISFAEVTIGLGRLHKLVHHFSSIDSTLASGSARHNIILASAPEEQHAFGVLLVSKIFEMEGWLVTGGPDLHTGTDLVSIVSESWFDIIGLSASSTALAHSLTHEITKLRQASLNPDVFVIVGGPGFAEDPELMSTIGADDVAKNADEAITKARKLLSGRALR